MSICYADDQVYQSIDKNGNIVIGNMPGGQIMQLPPLTIIPVQQMQRPLSSKELKRRQILQEELIKEQKSLKDVEKLLSQNLKTYDETHRRATQNVISEHKKNIEILTKQLSN